MDRQNEKFGLYCVHVNDIISTTTNSKEKVTLEGKFNEFVDGKVLLRCALFTDILAEARKFSLSDSNGIRNDSHLVLKSDWPND